jgi:hypothetical protein
MCSLPLKAHFDRVRLFLHRLRADSLCRSPCCLGWQHNRHSKAQRFRQIEELGEEVYALRAGPDVFSFGCGELTTRVDK